MSNWKVAALCIVGGGIAFSLPYIITARTPPLDRKEGKLTGTQRQRGMYMNAGSQDAGPDPDWDPVERKWKGHEKRQENGKPPTA